MKKNIAITVNSKPEIVRVDPQTPLLYVLRDGLRLQGPKFGCGLAQCGACTVLLDGAAVRSCVTPISSVVGRSVVTVDGLGSDGEPSVVQRAFIDEQAAQCGYCIPGMMMAATALLKANAHPSDLEIFEALDGNLCRCGTHLRILRAVKRAAGMSA